MQEQEKNNENLTSVEIAIKQFEDYLHDENLGSVRQNAWFDYLKKTELMDDWNIKMNELSQNSYPENKNKIESQIRIDELKIAAIDMQTDKNRQTLPGYNLSYDEIMSFDFHITDCVLGEHYLENPDDEDIPGKYPDWKINDVRRVISDEVISWINPGDRDPRVPVEEE